MIAPLYSAETILNYTIVIIGRFLSLEGRVVAGCNSICLQNDKKIQYHVETFPGARELQKVSQEVVILPGNGFCARVLSAHTTWEWHLCPNHKWSFYLGMAFVPEF